MIEYYTIALDIGPTFIRSALLDKEGNILPDSFSIFSSPSFESKAQLLESFMKIIKFNTNSILHPHFNIQHIGFSFARACFDDSKKPAINKDDLHASLMQIPSIRGKLSADYQIHLIEDVFLFAKGEHVLRKKEKQNKRVLYLILGSSVDYALMVNGELVATHNRLYHTQQLTAPLRKNQLKALEAYERFGECLAKAIQAILFEYAPDEMILGVKIAKSYPLFPSSLLSTLNQSHFQITASIYTTHYIFFGFSEYLKIWKNSIV